MNTSRNSGSARTALLCLVTAVGGAGATFFFAQKEKAALQAELTATRTQLTELKAEAPDAKEVEKLRAQVREAVELKREVEEIHRLRGEVTQLRKDKAGFEQAKAENAQLRVAAAQQAQRLQAENTALRGQFQTLAQAQAAGQPAPATGAFVQPGQARYACIANLKQIDGATQQWALENRKGNNSPVESGVLSYMKGSLLPVCPSSGAYRFPAVGGTPTCSVHGGL